MTTVCVHMSSAAVLKALFSSQTRVKLLSTFLLHPEKEYFIRELTRLLNEQINSIRRELENLRRIGLVRARHRNRKKYYHVDTEFVLYNDLRNLFAKVVQGESPLVVGLRALPKVKLVLLAGSLAGTESKVDLLVVGDVRRELLEALLAQDATFKNVKYSLFSEPDFLYRVSLRDRFVLDILNDPRHILIVNLLQQEIEDAMGKR